MLKQGSKRHAMPTAAKLPSPAALAQGKPAAFLHFAQGASFVTVTFARPLNAGGAAAFRKVCRFLEDLGIKDLPDLWPLAVLGLFHVFSTSCSHGGVISGFI